MNKMLDNQKEYFDNVSKEFNKLLDEYGLTYKDISNENKMNVIDKIKNLSSVSKKENRYNFHYLNDIVEDFLGFELRGCENNIAELGFDIPKENIFGEEKYKYCDYWHYQLDAVFRRFVVNDSNNSIYVGTKDGIDYKKVKVKPYDWQKFILETWNKLLYPLADKNGWIKIRFCW